MHIRVHAAKLRKAALLVLLPLAGCKPPAADNYVERVGISQRQAPSPPIASPDSKGAIWVPSPKRVERLLYGKPGQPPLMALECNGKGASAAITYTRFAAADRDAQAILALIGNGHVSRLKIDATREGDAWLWHGSVNPHDEALEALTGSHRVEATVPGAGSVILNASPLPGELIRLCRAQSPEPATPAATE
ncbi:MAG: hypothetical protein ABGW87_00810 [Sphingomonadaceae bacterium]